MPEGDVPVVLNEPQVAWMNGWRRTGHGLRLETIVQQGPAITVGRSPASLLMTRQPAFGKALGVVSGSPPEIVRIEVPDLSKLLSLKRPPGALLRRALPQTPTSRHVVFVAEGERGTAYIPASLLIRELWLWSVDALGALLTPGSLDLFLRGASADEEPYVDACGPFARARGENLRRLSWLAQCADARASWSSVLTYANAEMLNLRLPRASFAAWGLGIQLQRGILVSRLASPRITFTLPVEGIPMRIRGRTMRCPFPPTWTSDPQPDFWARERHHG